MQVEKFNTCDESIGTEGGCEVWKCDMIPKRTCVCMKVWYGGRLNGRKHMHDVKEDVEEEVEQDIVT